QPNFYGQSTSALQGGLPTDRLVAEWWLNSDRVRRILGKEPAAQPHIDSQPSDRVLERIEVPRAVADWKRNPQQRKLAEQLQSSNRSAFQAAFARGLAITGY